MRRIIYAWNYIEWGGAQIYTIALIKEARRSFDVLVLLPEGSDPNLLELLSNEGVRYELFPMASAAPLALTRIPKLSEHISKVNKEYAMLKAISRVGFDRSIVHVDLLPASSLFSLVWLALRAPIFVTVHNAMSRVAGWRWLLWKLKFGTISRFENFHVFGANEHAAKSFKHLFTKPVADEIKVTYASIHPPQIDRAKNDPIDIPAERKRFGIDSDSFVFLTVGQFVDRKGRWTLLEAARIVMTQQMNIRFVWIAPNIPTAAEQERIDSYGIGDSFRLIRSADIGTDRHSVLRFFQIADGFVLPSFVEGLPIALLEAMAIGLPSISTNIFGIPEAIINEETGILVEPGDANGLAEALIRIHTDRDLRERLSNSGREYVMSKFDDRVAAAVATAAYHETGRSLYNGNQEQHDE